MDGEISIKIKILDKEYPLRIPAAEEEMYRTVGKELNERCRELRDTYGARADKQDILSMVGFVAMLEKFKLETENQALQTAVGQKIAALQQMLDPAR
jgi:cell division protein ZapA